MRCRHLARQRDVLGVKKERAREANVDASLVSVSAEIAASCSLMVFMRDPVRVSHIFA